MPVAFLLMLGLMASERAWRRIGGFLLATAVLVFLAVGLPLLVVHPVVGIIGYTSAYLLRFVLVAGVASHLVATTSPSHLTAALRAARVPRAIVIPTAVTLRFLPVVAGETRAVWEAMRLRGMASSGDFLRHPVRFIEWLTVPAIASTLRVGDDLSASALLRGLGAHRRPTSIHDPRLGLPDLTVTVCVVAAAGVSAWLMS